MTRRTASFQRKTKETDIQGALTLDGEGVYDIETGIGFLDHMLEQWAWHGMMDVSIKAQGDIHVDCHHMAEDVGLALGDALARSLGEKKGIMRYGSVLSPMDDALVMVVVDCSGRGWLGWDVRFADERIGGLATSSLREFCKAFADRSHITLHVRLLCGVNDHHIAEAIFKGLGRALRHAVAIDGRQKDRIPSTKGQL
ncbi:MAG: imidazoleglycerol-phosphate dehydratase HisB [Alphaproteobacteria bacterium GM7ARS4]|nr:imidazoleglycerol-phosphate dehydratase HisB [Alphaproteobacteria bacterium GM7ARS4]